MRYAKQLEAYEIDILVYRKLDLSFCNCYVSYIVKIKFNITGLVSFARLGSNIQTSARVKMKHST